MTFPVIGLQIKVMRKKTIHNALNKKSRKWYIKTAANEVIIIRISYMIAIKRPT